MFRFSKKTSSLIIAVCSLIIALLQGKNIPQSVAAVSTPQPAEPTTQAGTDPAATVLVTRVIDGDTIVLATGEHVRYVGVDTPELHDKKTGGVQCYAGEAAQRNVELVFQKQVHLEKDTSNTDRYGRLLRYVYVGDTFVNKVLVTEGYAKAKEYKPDTHKHVELDAAMAEAQQAHRGMWGACPVQ